MSVQEEGRQEGGLAEALAAFHADIGGMTFKKTKTARVQGRTKDGRAFEYTYKYADLSDILPIVNPKLAAHGLSWTALLGLEADEFVLRYRLRHVSGESDEGWIPLGVSKGARPQEIGSAITYMRRYALTAMLNLAAEEDDDAQAAQSEPREEQPKPTAAPVRPSERPITAAQHRKLNAVANGLPQPVYANATREVLGLDPKVDESDEHASQWLHRNMDRFPARLMDGLLAVLEREQHAIKVDAS